MRPLALDLRAALALMLDQVDYLHGACEFTTPVGAALPIDVIDLARASLDAVTPMRVLLVDLVSHATFNHDEGTVLIETSHLARLAMLAGFRPADLLTMKLTGEKGEA